MRCNCEETLLNGNRVECPEHKGGAHDCHYIAGRNTLIPLAEAEATRMLGPAIDTDSTKVAVYRWTRLFAMAMERLSQQRGLTSVGMKSPTHRPAGSGGV